MSVKLASINILSFNDQNKVEFIRDFLDKYYIDICFIQETHVKDTQHMQIIKDKLYSYDIYSTLLTLQELLFRLERTFFVYNWQNILSNLNTP